MPEENGALNRRALPLNCSAFQTGNDISSRRHYCWTRELDQLLRRGYAEGPDEKQRSIDQVCLRTGWPRQACWDRARALHLVEGSREDSRRTWTADEIHRLLRLRPRQPVAPIAAELHRSTRSVREKLKRLRKLHPPSVREEDDHVQYTIQEVAGAMGRNTRIVYRWIEDKKLTAQPDPVSGELRVDEDEFWCFITLNYEEVVLNKVERDYLQWMCGELLPLARPRIAQKGGRRKKTPASESLAAVAKTAGGTSFPEENFADEPEF